MKEYKVAIRFFDLSCLHGYPSEWDWFVSFSHVFLMHILYFALPLYFAIEFLLYFYVVQYNFKVDLFVLKVTVKFKLIYSWFNIWQYVPLDSHLINLKEKEQKLKSNPSFHYWLYDIKLPIKNQKKNYEILQNCSLSSYSNSWNMCFQFKMSLNQTFSLGSN